MKNTPMVTMLGRNNEIKFQVQVTKDMTKCHGCGGLMPGHTIIFMAHLCQHYVCLCDTCLRELKGILTVFTPAIKKRKK